MPDLAGRVFAEPAWERLVGVLDDIESAGRDPGAALRVVAGWRDLAGARSVSEVLAWRLRRYTGGKPPPAAAAWPGGRSSPGRVRGTAAQAAAGRRPGSVNPRP
jgi:hypothetical protein